MYSSRLPAGFLPLFSHPLLVCAFLSLTFPPPHLPYTLKVSIFEKWTEQKRFPERTSNYPLPHFFLFLGTRGLTARLDQISQFTMETTQKGRSNYWREMADAREKDRKGNIKLSTTERVFQRQSKFECTLLCDKSENSKGHWGDVTASLLLRKNTG